MKKGKGSGRSNGLLPNSLRIISSCLKTVSANANSVASTVRSAGASVASSISVAPDDEKDQVLWAGFDKLELGPSSVKQVLLLGYSNGFQVLDVEDASNVTELVSKRDGPVTFLQMQPIPLETEGPEGFSASQPLLLVVAGEETDSSLLVQGIDHSSGLGRDGNVESQTGNSISSPTTVRFYSMRSHTYVHVLRFRSAVYMVRCGPRIVAVGLAAQIYCFDAVTLENKFSVLTYPVPQVGQGTTGVNIGYGAMAVGPRWLAYASNNPLSSNMGRLSPQNLTPSPGVSPSTSPGNGTLVARYAMESSKQLAAGIIGLGDIGYKTLSKYYQELLPDGSNSPVSSNSSFKAGRLRSATHSTETDSAGTVVVKDFVSRAVVSQFRAHTSPISALCFDPSGTLLVTASVYGNNINIFRIMPSCVQGESGTPIYDWSTSHVHLYKLYRGITTAVIQDICFSHYSQWISIVSSRGTCHIYVLSPFGGEAGLQTRSSVSDGPILIPTLTSPWWSSSSCTMNQLSFPPPAPLTLSVVSRIKNSGSGWLNTVSNVAASATGKNTPPPTGAVAVAFHNSLSHKLQSFPLKGNALEQLLVYTPSGHLVQHELLPSLGVESSDSDSGTGSGPLLQIQDEDLRVKVQPAQWWFVCRRSNWPEREEAIAGVTFDRQEFAASIVNKSDSLGINKNHSVELSDNTGGKFFAKPDIRSHSYISKAELQINFRATPIWQKSEIFFQTMVPLKGERKDYTGGEVEVEKILVHDVEIKRKDLLPVVDHFHNIKSDWIHRGMNGLSSYEPNLIHKFTEDSVTNNSTPTSAGSVGSSDAGSVIAAGSPSDLDQMKPAKVMLPSHVLRQNSEKSEHLLEHPNGIESLVGDHVQEPISGKNPPSKREVNKVYNAGSGHSGPSLDILAGEPPSFELYDPLDFGEQLQEGYSEVTDVGDCCKLGEVAPDADISNNQCERRRPDEDEESDDILGGVFAFSEEG